MAYLAMFTNPLYCSPDCEQAWQDYGYGAAEQAAAEEWYAGHCLNCKRRKPTLAPFYVLASGRASDRYWDGYGRLCETGDPDPHVLIIEVWAREGARPQFDAEMLISRLSSGLVWQNWRSDHPGYFASFAEAEQAAEEIRDLYRSRTS